MFFPELSFSVVSKDYLWTKMGLTKGLPKITIAEVRHHINTIFFQLFSLENPTFHIKNVSLEIFLQNTKKQWFFLILNFNNKFWHKIGLRALTFFGHKINSFLSEDKKKKQTILKFQIFFGIVETGECETRTALLFCPKLIAVSSWSSLSY